jgi:hypothetical protein
MAKRLFYVSAAVLMLAVAYQLGVSRARAQVGGEFAGIAVHPSLYSTVAITTLGDVYSRQGVPTCSGTTMVWHQASSPCGWTYMGNVLDGITVPIQNPTMTDMKREYREEE